MAYFLILVFLINFNFFSKDYGARGHLFEIKEEDIRIVLKKKMEKMPADIIKEKLKQMGKNAGNPSCVLDRKTKTNRKFFYDPSIIIPIDITDNQNTVIIKKGTKYNPLRNKKISSKLLFFDSEDQKQLKWAETLQGSYKWILTKGKPIEMENRYQRPVYFDQKGQLINKLGIKAIPAIVKQKGELLQIEEISID